VPADLDDVLRQRLQNSNKQEAIELYYELLSSGHSVGEILDTLGHLQGKSENGNITPAEHPSSGVDGTARAGAFEAASAGAAQADTWRISGLDSPLEAENRRIGEPQAAVGSETAPSNSQEPLQPGRFSNSAKRIAFGALCTAVASASIAGVAIVSGGRNADPGTIPGLATSRSEVVVAIPKSSKQVANAETPPAAPGSGVPGPLQRNTTEVKVPATASASTAHIPHTAEPGSQARAPAVNNYDAVGSGTGRPGNTSAPLAKPSDGQQIVRAFYTALERGNGEAASLLVIPEKREAGPFSAGELSDFYGRLELPFRLIAVDRVGEDLYDVTYSYKVRNGRFCKGRSLVRTTSVRHRVLIETIQSPSRC
jgi:hypothetical protein